MCHGAHWLPMEPLVSWAHCWSGRGREGGLCVCVCGIDLLVCFQAEEVAQEAVEEPLVEPLLEPEGENYEEPPQVRGQGGTVDTV